MNITNLDRLKNKVASFGKPKNNFQKNQSYFFNECGKVKKDCPYYSLILPTGGGKTYCSMRLALELGKDRIIYIAPYNSILEQTYSDFKSLFGDSVYRHYGFDHLEDGDETNKKVYEQERTYWDRKIIVTSFVQFFESIYNNKVSKSIKLTNYQNAVIIVDEVQNISDGFIEPIFKSLDFLSRFCGTKIIFATATPFNFDKMVGADRVCVVGNDKIEEFQKSANNIQYKYSLDNNAEDIINEACSIKGNTLIVVNRIDTALEYYDSIKKNHEEKEVLCLTTRLTPNHRKELFKHIKELFIKEKEFILVSTSIVEAGVDLDFDCGVRELCPLPSIIQTAGRVKRHRKTENGILYIVNNKGKNIHDNKKLEITDGLLRDEKVCIIKYNEKLGKISINKDEKGIIRLTGRYEYSTISDKFRLIEEKKQVFIACNEEGKRLFSDMKNGIFNFIEISKNTVNVSSIENLSSFVKEQKFGNITLLICESGYDEKKGLV
jgi:CRISPR-associated endonuclease/helicase Cas3